MMVSRNSSITETLSHVLIMHVHIQIREALATAANRLDRRAGGTTTITTTGHTSPTDAQHTATGSISDQQYQQRTEPTTPTRQSTVAQTTSSSNSGVKLDKFKNVVAAAAAAQHSRRRDPQSGLLCLQLVLALAPAASQQLLTKAEVRLTSLNVCLSIVCRYCLCMKCSMFALSL
jgi:hypothetical protein